MGIVDLKRTKEDKKAQEARYAAGVDEEDYPYGLRIHLNEETCKKLGLDNREFDSGQEVKLSGVGFIAEDNVTKVNGEKLRRISIQITGLDVSQEEKVSHSAALYGGD